MFPSKQSDKLVPQISSNPHKEDFGDQLGKTSEKLVDQEKYNCQYYPMNLGRDQNRTTILFSTSSTNNDSKSTQEITRHDDHDQRKITRKDNERQRRQQMTFLSSSLRSLLPLEMIKGKRSASDHMHEAANYITHLKSKIGDLKTKRDELRNPCDILGGTGTKAIGTRSGTYSESWLFNSSVVRPCLGGIEIVISSPFPLSRVLKILLEEEISVLGVLATRVNGRLIHTIQSETDDVRSSLDLSDLQQKLNIILHSSSLPSGD